MKRLLLFSVVTLLSAIHLFAQESSSLLAAAGQLAGSDPEILKVKATTVTVRVPAGYDRVTLQALRSRSGRRLNEKRAAPPQWKTVGVKYARGAETVLTFRLNRLTPRRHLRVFGERLGDELPGSLLTGISTFLGEPPTMGTSTGGGINAPLPGMTAGAAAADGALFSKGAAEETRSVVESDIWKLNGDRLYFFNELRGLQVFDLHDPDQPSLLGALRMPGTGEDMYLLDENHVVLLKKAWDFYWFGLGDIAPPIFVGLRGAVRNGAADLANSANASSSLSLVAPANAVSAAVANFAPERRSSGSREIVVVDVSAGQPEVLARVPFEGTLRESRLVGKVLYLATDVYRPAKDEEPPSWGLEVTSFDLHDPTNPVRQANVQLGGWADAVMATDRYFFVSKWRTDYDGQTIAVIDISDPNGAMERRGDVLVEGSVQDKFKMHLEGDVLTVVSAAWRNPDDHMPWRGQSLTKVTTFSLTDPNTPKQLGSLEIAPGETVRATRFDANRVYVVTFVQIDPLWVVDLTDPTAPTVLGHVEAPGFSTYIEPLGDRLVTIGLVNWRPAVSVFDVSRGAAPALLSQVILGGQEWTSSEAVWNEKAFTILPEKNLILIPLNSFSWTEENSGGVQLLDFDGNKLAKRGRITEAIDPRRTAVHRDRIVAISGTHLVIVDAADRDKPKVTAVVEIAWDVDRVFLVGDHLVELGSNWSVFAPQPTLTVTPANDPDNSLATLDLPHLQVAGATLRDGVLYILQVRQPSFYFFANAAEASDDGNPDSEPADNLVLSLIDVAHLPRIELLGSVSTRSPLLRDWSWGEALAHWLSETTLAFSLPRQGVSWFVPVWDDPPPYTTEGVADGGTTSVDLPGRWWPNYVWSTTQRIFAFDLADARTPKLVSAIELGDGEPWDVAPPVEANGRLFASHRVLGQFHGQDQWDPRKQDDPDAFDPPADSSVNRHFLQVVDYANPAAPFIEEESPNLPGRLIGLARSGKIFFTVGQQYDPSTGDADASKAVLHASAFDGIVVHLADQLPLESVWQPVALKGETVFLLDGEPAQIWKPTEATNDTADLIWRGWGGSYEDNPKTSSFTSWRLSEEGKFVKLGEIALDHEISFNLYGDLGVVFEQNNEPRFLDLSDPADIRDLGFHTFEGSLYLDYAHADGGLETGLWIPAGNYGVESIPFAR